MTFFKPSLHSAGNACDPLPGKGLILLFLAEFLQEQLFIHKNFSFNPRKQHAADGQLHVQRGNLVHPWHDGANILDSLGAGRQ